MTSSEALHGKITFDDATKAGRRMDVSEPLMVLTLSSQPTLTGLPFRTKKYKSRRRLDAYRTDSYESGDTACTDKLGLLPLNSLGR